MCTCASFFEVDAIDSVDNLTQQYGIHVCVVLKYATPKVVIFLELFPFCCLRPAGAVNSESNGVVYAVGVSLVYRASGMISLIFPCAPSPSDVTSVVSLVYSSCTIQLMAL